MTLGNAVYGFLHYNLQIYKKNVLLDRHIPFNLRKKNTGIKFIYTKREGKLLVESGEASFKN